MTKMDVSQYLNTETENRKQINMTNRQEYGTTSKYNYLKGTKFHVLCLISFYTTVRINRRTKYITRISQPHADNQILSHIPHASSIIELNIEMHVKDVIMGEV